MRLAWAVLAALLAAAPLAAAELPGGEGGIVADVDGTPLAVAYDAGADARPGDDRIVVAQGLREVGMAWHGAPLGTSAEGGLRGFRASHGGIAALAGAFARSDALVPDGPVHAWPYLGPDGVDLTLRVLGYDRRGGEEPLQWTGAWYDLGFGADYEGVSLPSALDQSSDGALDHQGRSLAHACAFAAEVLGIAHPACGEAVDALQAQLPDVGLRSELQRASVVLGDRAEQVLGTVGLLTDAALAGSDARDAAAPQPDEPFGQALLADLLGVLGAPPGAPPGAAPPASATTQDAGVSPVSLGPAAVPLAVAAALALAVPVWALYRRILPSRALQHPVREDLLRRVRAHPGIHESQLAREMGLRHTHVQYHIRVLAEAGVLEARKFGGLKCLFELGRHSPAEKAMAMAERGRSREVLLQVGAEPGIAQRDLARRLGMSESSVKWHLDRLAGAGFVRTERARGAKRAWVQPGALASPALPAAMPAPPLPAPPAPL